MKKAFKVALVLFLSVVAIILLALNFFGGQVIRKTVQVAGPAALGVPVTLEDAEFRVVRGYIRLTGLKVGNPAGYKTDNLFELGELIVDLNVRSLLGGVVHINKILIDGTKITYERGLTSSNLADLLAGLEKKSSGGTAPAEKEPVADKAKPAPAAGESGGTKVIIDEISITGTRVKLSLKVAQGLAAPVPLPPIYLKDIGKESGGAGILEVIKKVLGAVLGAVSDVVVGSVKVVGEGAAAVGGAAVDGAKAVGGAAVGGVKAVGQGAAVVGGAALDGASAVGGAAADGAKAVGKGAVVVGGAALDGAAAVGGAAADGAAAVGGAAVGGVKAVGKGVGAVAGGIGNLLGGGKKEEQPAAEAAPQGSP